MSAVSFHRNSLGMRELLLSVGTERVLQAKADRVLAAAEAAGVEVNGPHGGREPMPYDTRVSRSKTRVRVRITATHPAGLRTEAKYRTLGRALDAAR